jgi:hypothetical protein
MKKVHSLGPCAFQNMENIKHDRDSTARDDGQRIGQGGPDQHSLSMLCDCEIQSTARDRPSANSVDPDDEPIVQIREIFFRVDHSSIERIPNDSSIRTPYRYEAIPFALRDSGLVCHIASTLVSSAQVAKLTRFSRLSESTGDWSVCFDECHSVVLPQ